ncbi:MAG TPA: zinc-ribbon domain-containing protein [Thermoplasmatales archaeon]|nr:zinc-ribbon domain-containing protein [Thermoplasmatales archaeon]
MGTIRYCKKCGATLPEGVNVCPNCGMLQTSSSKSVLSAIIVVMLVTALLGVSFFMMLEDISKESERFFENSNNGNSMGDEGGNNSFVSQGEIMLLKDFSSPGWEEFDYAVEPSGVRVISTGTGYVIEADVRNLGLCEARSNYGWWSSDGRSCWGEWDFEFNDSETVDIQLRVGDNSPEPGAEYRVELDGSHLGDFQVPADDSWYIVIIPDVFVSAGKHTVFVGTYEMDFHPDYYLDYIKIGDLRLEGEEYSRSGGNDPNSDLQGLWVEPSDVKVQFWDGSPNDGGVLISEKTVGVPQVASDHKHLYLNNTFVTHFIPSNGVYTVNVSWDGSREFHKIYVVVDPYDELEEVDETNNVAVKTVNLS